MEVLLCDAGSIPETLGALTNLTELNLDDNQLAGIPAAIV